LGIFYAINGSHTDSIRNLTVFSYMVETVDNPSECQVSGAAVLLCKVAGNYLSRDYSSRRVILLHKLGPSNCLRNIQPDWIVPSVFGTVEKGHSRCFH
jgi:hypothetical protein